MRGFRFKSNPEEKIVTNPNSRILVLVKPPRKNSQKPKCADFGFSQIPKKKWSKTEMREFRF
jgi:hypothetical protein